MNKDEFDKTERHNVSDKDLKDALKDVLLAPRTKVRSQNREPGKDELEKRFRLDRRNKT